MSEEMKPEVLETVIETADVAQETSQEVVEEAKEVVEKTVEAVEEKVEEVKEAAEEVKEAVINYGDKTLACFDSSTYGAITQVPPYYTVEVLDLVPGLWYKLIERPTETPDGYRLYQCVRDGEVIEEEQWTTGIYKDDRTWKGVDGRIETDKEAEVKIGNKEGYGLRINKTWTDAKTMADHLLALWNDEALRKERSAMGLAHAERFSERRLFDDLMEVYNSLI